MTLGVYISLGFKQIPSPEEERKVSAETELYCAQEYMQLS